MIEKRKIQVILFLFTFLRYLNYSFLALTSGALFPVSKQKSLQKDETGPQTTRQVPFLSVYSSFLKQQP